MTNDSNFDNQHDNQHSMANKAEYQLSSEFGTKFERVVLTESAPGICHTATVVFSAKSTVVDI